MTLAKLLRRRRTETGQTLRDIADTLGVTQGAVAQWEAGRTRPDPARLSAIAAVYGLEPDAIRELWFAQAQPRRTTA